MPSCSRGNFIKAAEALHMTPSAVSHAVADAERQVGFKLFSRTRNGVVMTQCGADLYVTIQQLLNDEEALRQAIDQINGLERGTVRLGIFNSVCTNWMPDIFRIFGERYPHISASTSTRVAMTTSSVGSSWATWTLAFLSTSCTSDLRVEPLYRDPLICIVPPDFVTEVPDASPSRR